MPPADEEQTDVGASQLDVGLSFLGVLLLNLFILLMAAAQRSDGSVDTSYRQREPGQRIAVQAAYRLIYPFQQLWLVQGGKVARVDVVRAAQQLANGDTVKPTNPVKKVFSDDTSISIELPADGQPTGFLLTIERPTSGPPPSAAEGPFDKVYDLTTAAEQASTFAVNSRFVVWRGDVRAARRFLGRMQRLGRNPRIIESSDKCNGRWCIKIRRDLAGFSTEAVFR